MPLLELRYMRILRYNFFFSGSLEYKLLRRWKPYTISGLVPQGNRYLEINF